MDREQENSTLVLYGVIISGLIKSIVDAVSKEHGGIVMCCIAGAVIAVFAYLFVKSSIAQTICGLLKVTPTSNHILSTIDMDGGTLLLVHALISNTKGEGKEGDPFWTKSETLLYCALIAYIIFEGPAEDRNMNTLVDMISGMEVKEDDEDFMNAVDYMFAGLEKRKPDCFAVKQYKKYKLASGDICSK